MYIYIYIYIERDRCMYVYTYIYIYTYIHTCLSNRLVPPSNLRQPKRWWMSPSPIFDFRGRIMKNPLLESSMFGSKDRRAR